MTLTPAQLPIPPGHRGCAYARRGREAGAVPPELLPNPLRLVSTGSLGDMEAGEEVQLVGASHTEQKAIAPEAPSPPSAGESD